MTIPTPSTMTSGADGDMSTQSNNNLSPMQFGGASTGDDIGTQSSTVPNNSTSGPANSQVKGVTGNTGRAEA